MDNIFDAITDAIVADDPFRLHPNQFPPSPAAILERNLFFPTPTQPNALRNVFNNDPLVGDPSFVDPDNTDPYKRNFQLRVNSPAIDQAIDVRFNNDFFGGSNFGFQGCDTTNTTQGEFGD